MPQLEVLRPRPDLKEAPASFFFARLSSDAPTSRPPTALTAPAFAPTDGREV